mmetsp:Transcript_78032/g.252309  ORF Transcript_78032/g.252309 Transcript_78032/m.252309 type:complete len:308 (-) Transcript_78032:1042-1965(-)
MVGVGEHLRGFRGRSAPGERTTQQRHAHQPALGAADGPPGDGGGGGRGRAGMGHAGEALAERLWDPRILRRGLHRVSAERSGLADHQLREQLGYHEPGDRGRKTPAGGPHHQRVRCHLQRRHGQLAAADDDLHHHEHRHVDDPVDIHYDENLLHDVHDHPDDVNDVDDHGLDDDDDDEHHDLNQYVVVHELFHQFLDLDLDHHDFARAVGRGVAAARGCSGRQHCVCGPRRYVLFLLRYPDLQNDVATTHRWLEDDQARRGRGGRAGVHHGQRARRERQNQSAVGVAWGGHQEDATTGRRPGEGLHR